MSVKSASTLSQPLLPNSSLILDVIDDEEEAFALRARHASYGFFNRKFTRDKLKSVFPAGFTVERVRTDKDLLGPGVVKINGKTKKTVDLKSSSQTGAQELPGSSMSSTHDRTKKSFTDVFRGGSSGFPDDMTDNSFFHGVSNNTHKGDDFADVAGPYYQEMPAVGRNKQEPLISIPLAREDQQKEGSQQKHLIQKTWLLSQEVAGGGAELLEHCPAIVQPHLVVGGSLEEEVSSPP